MTLDELTISLVQDRRTDWTLVTSAEKDALRAAWIREKCDEYDAFDLIQDIRGDYLIEVYAAMFDSPFAAPSTYTLLDLEGAIRFAIAGQIDKVIQLHLAKAQISDDRYRRFEE